MFHRQRLFILIPTLLLIPLLAGMIPLRLAHKLAHGGTCTQCQDRHGCGLKNCSTHSIISQNHFDGITEHSASHNQGLSYLQKALPVGPEFYHSQICFAPTPLRC
jgi:hypothetical protein